MGYLARRITLATSLFYLIAAPAHALDVGHCDTPEGLSAKIKAEGHKIAAQMDRLGVSLKRGGIRHDVAQFITATPDLKRWYLVGGDEPLSKRSSEMCVVLAGRTLEINDYRQDGPATVTRYDFDRQKALAGCDSLNARFEGRQDARIRCNEFNEGLRNLSQEFNERIALQGVTDQKTLMTIIASPDAKSATQAGTHTYHALATTPAGAAMISGGGVNFSFSAWILKALDTRHSKSN